MTNLLIALLVLATVGLGLLLMRVVLRWQSEERAREVEHEKQRAETERKQKLSMQEKVKQGTHLEDGRPVCRVDGCLRPATTRRVHVVLDELSGWQWLRRRMGAPRRHKARVGGFPEYCDTCAPLGSQVVDHGLAESAARVARMFVEEDATLSHLESEGVDQAVAELVRDRRQQSVPPPAKAVQAVRRLP